MSNNEKRTVKSYHVTFDIDLLLNHGASSPKGFEEMLINGDTGQHLPGPEAAKLLPQPTKNEKALAPTELAESVRSMLRKGVPPVTTAQAEAVK